MRNIQIEASSSSIAYNGSPEKAVDGIWKNGVYGDPNYPSKVFCAHTSNEPSWIRVDLGEEFVVASLLFVGRNRDEGHPYHSKNWTIRISNTTDNNSGEICASNVDASGGYWVPITCNSKLTGRYATISSENDMVLCEIQVLITNGKYLLFIK